MTAKIISFIIWFTVWCGLCMPVSRQDLVLGVIVALFVTFMTTGLAGQLDGRLGVNRYSIVHNLRRCFWMLYYVVVFLWECVKANIDVAYRVLHPDLPIRPGTVAVNVNLKSDIGLTFLANSITLTPGTTSVDIDKENGILYVHWLYVKADSGSGRVRLPVVEKFENILKRVFE